MSAVAGCRVVSTLRRSRLTLVTPTSSAKRMAAACTVLPITRALRTGPLSCSREHECRCLSSRSSVALRATSKLGSAHSAPSISRAETPKTIGCRLTMFSTALACVAMRLFVNPPFDDWHSR